MQSNYQDIPALMSLAKDLKARKVLISNVLPYHEGLIPEVLYDLDDSTPLFGSEAAHAIVANTKLRSHRNCRFIESNSVSINWQGQVAPCYALMHSHKCYVYGREKEIKAYSFGDLAQEKLLGIWQKPHFANLRYRVKDRKSVV